MDFARNFFFADRLNKQMNSDMSQVDHERLSAYFDGELNEVEARQVMQLIASQAQWAQAYAQLQALDDVLDTYETPSPAADLSARIIAASRQAQRPRAVRVLRIALPIAAAAAIALAAVLVWPTISGRHESQNLPVASGGTGEKVQAVETLASEQLHFFTNIESIQTLADNESLLNDDTMAALAELEGPRQGS